MVNERWENCKQQSSGNSAEKFLRILWKASLFLTGHQLLKRIFVWVLPKVVRLRQAFRFQGCKNVANSLFFLFFTNLVLKQFDKFLTFIFGQPTLFRLHYVSWSSNIIKVYCLTYLHICNQISIKNISFRIPFKLTHIHYIRILNIYFLRSFNIWVHSKFVWMFRSQIANIRPLIRFGV